MRLQLLKSYEVRTFCSKHMLDAPQRHPVQAKTASAPETQSAVALKSRRQLLLAGASIAFAPRFAQQAQANPIVQGVSDSAATSFNGFDGLGGDDSDYATAEVCLSCPLLSHISVQN